MIYKVKPYLKSKKRLIQKKLKAYLIKLRFGIKVPYDITIGEHVSIACNKDIELTIGNDVLIGDYSMVKCLEKTSLNIGNNVSFRRAVLVSLFGGNLKIGNNVFFNNNCSISCLGTIEIGEKTMFGENVKMYDHNHKYEQKPEGIYTYPNEFTIGHIKIGKNCWIASDVTILNNVTIGDNCIIGAGCLIFKSIPPNTIIKNKQNLIISTQ